MKILIPFFLAASSLLAQANDLPSMPSAQTPANNAASQPPLPSAGQIRAECLQGRRLICGKILDVLPGGLVIESGYTDLLRPPLTTSWLVPGMVQATRPANLVESSEPGSVCVGVVFLSNIPKSRGPAAKPKKYDYVIMLGYPAGEYTYTSIGTVQKTVRRFTGLLAPAVRLTLNAEPNPTTAKAASK